MLITTVVVTLVVPGAPFITHGAIWLAALINGAAMSWILAPLACWAALSHGHDPQAGGTARWMFVLLPIGALVGFSLSVIAGVSSGSDSWVLAVIAVILAATFVATATTARALAIRYARADRLSG